MRVTFSQINTNVQRNLMQALTRLSGYQEQLSSGRRLNRPSDSPLDVKNDLKLRSRIGQNEQFMRNVDDGMASMGISDSALVSMNELFQRARELTLQGSNDTLTVRDRTYLAQELRQITDQLVQVVNTSYKGEFIFAGTNTNFIPYELQKGVTFGPTAAEPNFQLISANGKNTLVEDQIEPFYQHRRIIPGTLQVRDSLGALYTEGVDYTMDYDRGELNVIAGGALNNPMLLSATGPLDTFPAGPVTVGQQFFLSGQGITPGALVTPGLVEGQDYAVDYQTGQVTVLNAAAAFPATLDYEFNNIPNDITVTFDTYRKVNTANSGEVKREIEQNVAPVINVGADAVVENEQGQINTIGVFLNIVNGLETGNGGKVRTGLANLDIMFNQALGIQSLNGSRLNRFELTRTRIESQNIETTRLQSDLEDVDFAETVMQYQMQENAYNAALKSAAKVILPTLGDFI
jgi:flagellar hook-associated protein 3 FlgL